MSNRKATRGESKEKAMDDLAAADILLNKLGDEIERACQTLTGPYVEHCRRTCGMIEDMPLAPFIQGGLASIAGLGMKRHTVLLRGPGKKPYVRGNSTFQITFAGVNAMKTIVSEATGAKVTRDLVSELSVQPYAILRELVAPLIVMEDGSINQFVESISPPEIYRMAGANPKQNTIVITNDEFDAILSAIEDPASQHNRRFYLQAWDPGRSLFKQDTVSTTLQSYFYCSMHIFGQFSTLLRLIKIDRETEIGLGVRMFCLVYKKPAQKWAENRVDAVADYEKFYKSNRKSVDPVYEAWKILYAAVIVCSFITPASLRARLGGAGTSKGVGSTGAGSSPSIFGSQQEPAATDTCAHARSPPPCIEAWPLPPPLVAPMRPHVASLIEPHPLTCHWPLASVHACFAESIRPPRRRASPSRPTWATRRTRRL